MKKERIIGYLWIVIGIHLSGVLYAQSYDAKPYAKITMDNGIVLDTTMRAGESYAGKAPLEATFYAGITLSKDRLHYLWEVANNPEYSNSDVAYEKEFTRQFNKKGTYYVRLTLTDLDNDSTTQYDPFSITLAESKLKVPNTFTPNGDGSHDVLKVSYESLVKFHAAIYNRWGKRLYAWDDPEGGWDGGDAKPGVYFIAVDATGADGQEYSIRQAVNLLKSLSENYE